MQILLGVLTIALLFISTTFAVFADDAYHIDYHHELLGLPIPHTTFFYQPRQNEKASLLYTLSDLGVLGAVNPGTGKIVWRQALGDGHAKGFLRGVEGERTIISGLGNRVDGWDAMSGIAKWGNEYMGTVRDLKIVGAATEDGSIKNVLVLFEENGSSILRLLSGDSGVLVWEYKDTTEDIPWHISTNLEDVFLISLLGAKGPHNLRVSTLNLEHGKKINDYTIQSKADINSGDDILVAGIDSALPFIAWTDKAKENLKVNILTRYAAIPNTLPLKLSDDKVETVTLHVPHLPHSQPHFLVYMESKYLNKAEVYHIDPLSKKINRAYELPELHGKRKISVSCLDTNVFFTIITQDQVISVLSTSHEILGRWPMKTEIHGGLLHGTSEIVQRAEDSYAIRFTVLTSHETFIMVRNGVEVWVRQEGLSGAVAAGWAEIPEIESLAATLQAEAHSNPFYAYTHRVNRHIKDLRYLPGYLKKLPGRVLGIVHPTQLTNQLVSLERDSFGFNKILYIATVRGSVYALNSGNQGAVVWYLRAFNRSASNKWDVKGIWADNTKGVVSIRGSNGEFLLLNSTTGFVIEKIEPGPLPTVGITAVVESIQGRWLLPIDEDGTPDNLSHDYTPKGFLVTKSKNGEVKGFKFEGEEKPIPVVTWTFKPKSGQKVINVISRPTHDPVASIGRVLGDRNVLYKYLNPNIILITAVSELASTASFYLLDSVSGEIIHSSTHQEVDVRKPITSTLTENWFVYSLWSDILSNSTGLQSSKGYQIVVSELFESNYPNDRGPLGSADRFSSLEPLEEFNPEPPLVHVVSQSYLIPEPISHMTVTQTLQGITSRQLICVLAHSNAVIGIPRTLLDPRRPVGRAPTPLEVEEGLFQYQPFIEFNPKMAITHEREVMGIQGVITMPVLLESTSLLLAYGIDIFGTRVTPSLAFDILGKEFNKLSLLATVLALAVGVGILAPMVCFRVYFPSLSTDKFETDKNLIDFPAEVGSLIRSHANGY